VSVHLIRRNSDDIPLADRKSLSEGTIEAQLLNANEPYNVHSSMTKDDDLQGHLQSVITLLQINISLKPCRESRRSI
jgi:hypothetical protein